jgi:hypothetical protein
MDCNSSKGSFFLKIDAKISKNTEGVLSRK